MISQTPLCGTESRLYGVGRGYLAACNVWGLGMFLQMLSYAAIAREAGLGILEVIASTLMIWGLPGQIAMVDLMASGASLLAIALVVSMANARMMAMSVSALPIMPGKSFFARLLMAQTIGVTSWLYTREQLSRLPEASRTARFYGFYLFMSTAAVMGNILGYYSHRLLPDNLMRLVVFLGPVFLMLMISAARDPLHRLTAFMGAGMGVGTAWLLEDISVIFAGVTGGMVGYAIEEYYRRRREEET